MCPCSSTRIVLLLFRNQLVLSRRANARNRKLYDAKTDQKWVHDLYVEEEQAPKTEEERQVGWACFNQLSWLQLVPVGAAVLPRNNTNDVFVL